MANPEHLAILNEALAAKDIAIWNEWRENNPTIFPDLNGADLEGESLPGIDLHSADISFAFLYSADLRKANFRGAFLNETVLINANLYNANLREARLSAVNFLSARMEGADFMYSFVGATQFDDVNLSPVIGLETVSHLRPSEVSISTLYRSGGNIPEIFLRGCGVPETMITFAKSLVGKPIQYYSAFISYSSQDEHFARRLHNDLQMKGVRVWFAPEDLKIGEPIEDSIDQAIRMYDKLIIVLSQNSIDRAWVKKEFSKAIEKEKQHSKTVLFPIRLDDSVFDTTEQWAYDVRKRHIGDFRDWVNPLKYQNAINRLLRDLNSG